MSDHEYQRGEDHAYTSTACLHGQHDECRRTCKFCAASCRCSCHHTTADEAAPTLSPLARRICRYLASGPVTDGERAAILTVLGHTDCVPRTWHGLIDILDEHYPPDIFVGSTRDQGPRIVALTRAVERAEREADRLRDGIRDLWETWMSENHTWVEVAGKLDDLWTALGEEET